LGHTLARNKHGGTTHRASYVKAWGVIEELLLTALLVDNLFNPGTESSNLYQSIVTLNCDNVNDRDNKGNSSDNEDYHPTSVVPLPPPSRLPKQRKIEPKIVLNHMFMTFLCPITFDNQPFCKGKLPLYTDADLSTFQDQF
jgi:hypothetical protein